MSKLENIHVTRRPDGNDLLLEDANLIIIAAAKRSGTHELIAQSPPPTRPGDVKAVWLPKKDPAMFWALAYRSANIVSESGQVVIAVEDEEALAVLFMWAAAKIIQVEAADVEAFAEAEELPALDAGARKFLDDGPPQTVRAGNDSDLSIEEIYDKVKAEQRALTLGERWLSDVRRIFEALQNLRYKMMVDDCRALRYH